MVCSLLKTVKAVLELIVPNTHTARMEDGLSSIFLWGNICSSNGLVTLIDAHYASKESQIGHEQVVHGKRHCRRE